MHIQWNLFSLVPTPPSWDAIPLKNRGWGNHLKYNTNHRLTNSNLIVIQRYSILNNVVEFLKLFALARQARGHWFRLF